MITVCELVQRRSGMSVEEFQAYWRDVHGPIVSRLPGVTRYVQCHPLLGGYRKGPLVYDGVAELSFESKDALRAAASTAEFAAAKRDEPNFIDTATLVELVVDQVVIKDGVRPAEGVRSIAFVRFPDGMAPEEGHRYWRDVHGPLAVGIPQLRRYVQYHVRMGAYGRAEAPAWDGMAMTWFDGIEDMRASAGTAAYAAVRADGPLILRDDRSPTLLCRELVLVDG